jgi:hypothetical protein
VRGECRQDLLLLLVWHLEKVKSSAKFGSALIELGGRDLQFAMRLFQVERSIARSVAAYCCGPPAPVQTHRVRMNFRPGSPPQVFGRRLPARAGFRAENRQH